MKIKSKISENSKKQVLGFDQSEVLVSDYRVTVLETNWWFEWPKFCWNPFIAIYSRSFKIFGQRSENPSFGIVGTKGLIYFFLLKK